MTSSIILTGWHGKWVQFSGNIHRQRRKVPRWLNLCTGFWSTAAGFKSLVCCLEEPRPSRSPFEIPTAGTHNSIEHRDELCGSFFWWTKWSCSGTVQWLSPNCICKCMWLSESLSDKIDIHPQFAEIQLVDFYFHLFVLLSIMSKCREENSIKKIFTFCKASWPCSKCNKIES